MAANGISTLATKELRQKAKLDLAATNRAADGNARATYDITQLPTQYDGNDIIDNPNYPVGGTITTITIATPLTRGDGGNYLTPANVSIQFALPSTGGGVGSNRATGTPVITSGKLSGITIVSGGSGYAKRNTDGLLNGQVRCDIFVIDSTSGSPDTRELRDITTSGFDVSASDIISVGLVEGRPWTAVASIRALLSGTGQTAFDAAASDAFFAVSQTDYNAVVAGVASVSTVGPTDAEFASTAGSPFSATYIVTYPQAAATVPASNYILGFKAVTGTSNSQWRIYGGPTFKSTSPVYSQISSDSPSTGAGAPGIGTFYYLRKAPTVQAATTYIGIYGTKTLVMTAAGTFTGGGYTNAPFTTWFNWTTVMPKVQVIITPTAVV
jgi:hypothetical protein